MAGSEPMVLSVREAAEQLGISRNLAYDLVAQGRLPHIRLGRPIRIPRQGLEEWTAKEAKLPEPSQPVVTLRQRL